MPTIRGGFWAPWLPSALAILWPFAWTLAVVLDHHSRAVVAVAVFRSAPTTRQVCALLDRASANAGRRPRHLVTDQGCQFGSEYLAWCRRRGIRPRFGAVGKHGSIAVLERFIRSMKEEHLRRITLPFKQCDMLREAEAYARWYNTERSHTALDGATPSEILRGTFRRAPPIETRARYPPRTWEAPPPAPRHPRDRPRPLRGTLAPAGRPLPRSGLSPSPSSRHRNSSPTPSAAPLP